MKCLFSKVIPTECLLCETSDKGIIFHLYLEQLIILFLVGNFAFLPHFFLLVRSSVEVSYKLAVWSVQNIKYQERYFFHWNSKPNQAKRLRKDYNL